MTDDVRVIASARPEPGRGLSTGAALGLVAALIVGLIVGRATGADHCRSRCARGQGQDAGPSRLVSGVPVGYAHSRRGAVAATLNYGAVLAGPAFLSTSRRAQALAVVASPRYARQVQRSAAPALEQVGHGPIGAGLRAGEPTLFESAPISYRVLRYSREQVVVAVWGIALVGNATAVQPQADYQTTTSTLAWINGDWKFVAGRSDEGPVPALSSTAKPTPGGRFLQSIDGFQALRHEP